MTEFCFSVDDLQDPKLYKDAEAAATLLTRLILLEPGTIQSHPDMGVGIISRFRYSVEGEAARLQTEIQNQIERYLPRFRGAIIRVREANRQYIITAEIDDTLYGIYYDVNTSNLAVTYTKLSNL